jgi:hypothetical protein
MIYRKRGSVVRLENDTIVRVAECGVAIEEGDFFECSPDPQQTAPPFPVETIEAPDVACERLIISHGVAEHECEGRVWSEETRRVHASLTSGRVRALIDTTSIDDVLVIAKALERIGAEREAPPRLRLAPNVTAALLPALVGLAPPNVRLVQSTGGVDGYGNPILETDREWPNFYRPSYRVRPVRMPLNLRLECDANEIDESRPRAIALLAPVDLQALRVLIVDGTDVYPATVRVTRIDAVSNVRTWYPYGGGSFGAELML